MTEILSSQLPQPIKSGKHNMASAAFEELRAARREGRTPESNRLSFGDLVDTLNPLQHIPVVSEIYRSITGDGISPHARVAGGGLYGGPVGLMASIASLAITGTEEGVGDRIFASLTGSEQSEAGPVAIAAGTEISGGSGQTAATQPRQVASINEPPPSALAFSQPAAKTNPLPQLSPEAFQALIGSFSDAREMREANESLAFALDPENDEVGAAAEVAANSSGDLARAMQQALDKYEALGSARSVAAE